MNARTAKFVVLALLLASPHLYGQDQQTPTPAGRSGGFRRTPASAQREPRPVPAAAGPLVTLEVLIVEHTAANDGEKRGDPPSAAQFVELHKQGKLDRVLRVQMSAVDQNPSLVQLGERVPVATGRASRGGFGGRGGGGGAEGDGPFTYTYTMEEIGTIVRATSRVEEGGAVLVDLHVERSQIVPHDGGGDESRDIAIGRQKTTRLSSQSTLRLKPGEPAIAEGWQSTSGADTSGTFIVVTANVEAGGERAAAVRDAKSQLNVFYLRTAKAADVQKVVEEVFGGRPMRVSADEKTNRIIVSATAEQLLEIRQLIQALDSSEK